MLGTCWITTCSTLPPEQQGGNRWRSTEADGPGSGAARWVDCQVSPHGDHRLFAPSENSLLRLADSSCWLHFERCERRTPAASRTLENCVEKVVAFGRCEVDVFEEKALSEMATSSVDETQRVPFWVEVGRLNDIFDLVWAVEETGC